MDTLNVQWSSVDKGASAVISNNGLTAMVPNNTNNIKATVGRKSGKWYWELTIDNARNIMVGICNEASKITDILYNTPNAKLYYNATGNKYQGAIAYGERYAAGDVISIALDMDLGTIEFYKNGVSQGVAFSDLKHLGEVFPVIAGGATGTEDNIVTANFGAIAFKYSIPQGYLAYNTNIQEKILLSKNNKWYTTHSTDFWHETKMTSNTTPVPLVASASSQYSTSYAPFKAFNAIASGETNSWVTSSGVKNGWIQIDFNKQIKINMFSITSGDYSASINSEPKDFTLYGSNNGTTFDEIITINGQTGWKLGEARVYLLNVDTEYSIFKLQVNDNNGFSYLRIAELKFGYKKRELIAISKIDKSAFFIYGKENFDDLGADFTVQTYALNDHTKNKKVTKKPLSIRFD